MRGGERTVERLPMRMDGKGLRERGAEEGKTGRISAGKSGGLGNFRKAVGIGSNRGIVGG